MTGDAAMTMDRARRGGMLVVASLGAIAAAVQAELLIGSGQAFCLNDGCRIVEGLTRVPPVVINVVGSTFFAMAALLTWCGKRSRYALDLLAFLLLAGIAAEGVLFGYQAFAAKTFCSWCLIVCTLVVLLNLLFGARQAVRAALVFMASVLAFAALAFGVMPATDGGRGLDRGTWGVHRCAAPAKRLYLIFSSSCPHCAEVIRALETCNSCTLHFNPVDRGEGLDLPGVEQLATYDPAVNRELLALLGITEVPVLLVPSPEGVSVIRGERRIIAFIRAECFLTPPVLNVDPSRNLDDGSMSIFLEEEGCNVQVECPPESK